MGRRIHVSYEEEDTCVSMSVCLHMRRRTHIYIYI